MEPYRSRLPEANALSTSFCYVDEFSTGEEDIAVCLPNSDSSSEGSCVSCISYHYLKTAIYNGTLLKDEASIAIVKSTCHLKRDPDMPQKLARMRSTRRRKADPSGGSWSRASSLIVGRPGMSAARSYLDILLKAAFGADAAGNFSLILTSPELEEGNEEESK
jgi:hypothetical protein